MRPSQSAGTLVLSLASLWTGTGRAEAQEMIYRRANNVTIPAAISIAPSQYWEGNDGPWSSFPFQVGGGSTSQNIRLFPSTTAYNIIAIGPKGCPDFYGADCPNRRGAIYDPSKSLTWVSESVYGLGIEQNLANGSFAAQAGYDQVTLGWQGSGGPTIQHTPIFNISLAYFYFVGAFGLNPQPTNFSSLNNPQTSYMQALYDKSYIPSRSYGYTAGNQYRFSKVYGSLTLGGYDENRFSGGVQWAFHGDVSRDLVVQISSITSDGGTNLLPDGKISSFIDSTVGQMWLPISACQAFEKAFGLTWNSAASFYFLDSSTHANLVKTNATVTFTLNNGTTDLVIALPYSAFDLSYTDPAGGNATYYFPLKQAANDTQYTLGRVFLQEAYLIADYDRSTFTVAPCLWNPTKISSQSIKSILSPNLTTVAAQQSDAASNKSSGLPAGAIAGIVVGVIVLVLVAVAIAFFFIRRKKRAPLAELPEKGDGIDSVDAKVDPGHELGSDGQRQELDAPNLYKPQEMESPYKMDPNRHGYVEVPTNEHYGPGKGWAHEVDGAAPIYEMAGSDVQELPPQTARPKSDASKK